MEINETCKSALRTYPIAIRKRSATTATPTQCVEFDNLASKDSFSLNTEMFPYLCRMVNLNNSIVAVALGICFCLFFNKKTELLVLTHCFFVFLHVERGT